MLFLFMYLFMGFILTYIPHKLISRSRSEGRSLIRSGITTKDALFSTTVHLMLRWFPVLVSLYAPFPPVLVSLYSPFLPVLVNL